MAFSKNPSDNFQRILYWQHLVLKLIGVDAYGPGYRRTFLTYTIVFLAFLFIFISLIDLVLFRNDLFNFTFVLVTIFYALIGIGRLSIFLTKTVAARQIVLDMETIYRDASTDMKEEQVLHQYNNQLRICVIFYSLVFMGGVVLAGLLPFPVYLWTAEKILPFGVVVPFVDSGTSDGYQLNYLYQLSCMLWTPPGLIASQNFYFAFSFNVCIQYDILVLKLQTLDDIITNIEGDVSSDKIHEHLISIIRYQQRLVKFISDLEDLYTLQMFIEVACNAMQIIMTLFVLHIAFWLPGILLVFVSSFQLFLPCMLGTLIDIKSDLFIQKTYAVSWHAMPKVEQKMLKFMLTKSQRSKKLSCGGMMTLDMNLFLAVYKKIYSIFMMLQSL